MRGRYILVQSVCERLAYDFDVLSLVIDSTIRLTFWLTVESGGGFARLAYTRNVAVLSKFACEINAPKTNRTLANSPSLTYR
jgi:hypothetical protein